MFRVVVAQYKPSDQNEVGEIGQMPDASAKSFAGRFVREICVYFRDFLDSDFKGSRAPKRSITARDQRGNLTGISVAKYPDLCEDLCHAERPTH